MSIKQMNIKNRPREKASLGGLSTLGLNELLALIIKSGTKNNDALAISNKILSVYHDLNALALASQKELEYFEGIGPVKALDFQVIFEIAKRFSTQTSRIINSIDVAISFARNIIGESTNEKFLVLMLDKMNNVIHYKILYEGTNSEISINPKEVISFILRKEAPRFYCFHNHPSGNANPSRQDISLTKRIKQYSQLFGIEFVGHIIVSKNKEHLIN